MVIRRRVVGETKGFSLFLTLIIMTRKERRAMNWGMK